MTSRLPSKHLVRSLKSVHFATQAAAKPSTSHSALPKHESKLTKLPNGIVVASLENYTPISRISVAFKAGSRNETSDNLGVTHSLRNCAGLSTQNATIFGITRNIQQIGGSLTASSTREVLSYDIECNRDDLESALGFLLQVSTKQVFKPWEVNDFYPRLKLDLAVLKNEPDTLAFENLHKAAYRVGLGNSLFTPSYMLGEHEPEMLKGFVQNHFTTNNTAVVGIGVDHEKLVEYANNLPLGSGSGAAVPPTKYGGGEIRVETSGSLTYVAVATEGSSLKSHKDVLSLAVLQNVLGSGPNIKWGNGLATNKLAQVAAKSTEKPFAISGFNVSYSDSGLFGFYAVGHHDDMGKILKGVFTQYSSVTKSGVNDGDVQRAKNQVKAAIAFAQESNSQLLDELTSQALITGQLISLPEIFKIVDSITASDVTGIAKKVINGKPSMACVGNLSHTPYLDQLL